eukprot:scaffold8287_cov36-Tisochrysis_lutea.AAC.10
MWLSSVPKCFGSRSTKIASPTRRLSWTSARSSVRARTGLRWIVERRLTKSLPPTLRWTTPSCWPCRPTGAEACSIRVLIGGRGSALIELGDARVLSGARMLVGASTQSGRGPQREATRRRMPLTGSIPDSRGRRKGDENQAERGIGERRRL